MVIGLVYYDEAIELNCLKQSLFMVLPGQRGRLMSGKSKGSKPNIRGQNRTADYTEVLQQSGVSFRQPA